jgi:hypothetical protein
VKERKGADTALSERDKRGREIDNKTDMEDMLMGFTIVIMW